METVSQETSSRRRRSTRPLDVPQTLVGRVLDERYRLDRVLNTGGMGIIFEATQLGIGRVVAVKLLKPTLTSDPMLVTRFALEVELVASLSHPNIVTLLDSGRDAGGLTYLVMEFVDGLTFREALRERQLTLVEVIEVFAQTCNALIETHARGIIHRDLKFDNIMLMRQRDGRLHVKLLDFGVAKLLWRDQNLTQNGQVAGTPGIIAPELVDGARPTARSDLYSLGVLLYTALAGEAPFRGANDLELMRAHKTFRLPRLDDKVGEEVPEALIELVNELLEKKPEGRPSDARQVRDRLEVIGGALAELHPDAQPYRPPRPSSNVPNPPELEIFEEARGAGITDVAEIAARKQANRGLIRRIFKEPVVAPFTVVAALSLLLMLLVLVIVYMFYQMLILQPPG